MYIILCLYIQNDFEMKNMSLTQGGKKYLFPYVSTNLNLGDTIFLAWPDQG
jgi:hypothetical protein